ncbi:MAG TPA: metalloregulator ArsR/SmtB family transcription factor [Mycobacteriales bacterium]
MPKGSARLDATFAALANPARRAVVARLALGPATVSELAAPLAMTLPSVLQHLSVLEAAGLVTSTKRGRVRTCRLDRAALGPAEQWLRDRRREGDRGPDRRGGHLAEHPS